MNLLTDPWILTTDGREIGILDALASPGISGVAHGWSVVRMLMAEAQKACTPVDDEDHIKCKETFLQKLTAHLEANKASWEFDAKLQSARCAALTHNIDISMLTADRSSGSSAIVFSSQAPVDKASLNEAVRAAVIMPVFGACAKYSDATGVPKPGSAKDISQLFLQGPTVWETLYLNLWTAKEVKNDHRYTSVLDLVSRLYRPVHDIHFDMASGKFALSARASATPLAKGDINEPFALLRNKDKKVYQHRPAPVSSYWESLEALVAYKLSSEVCHLSRCLDKARMSFAGSSFDIRSVGLTCDSKKYSIGLGQGYTDSQVTMHVSRMGSKGITKAADAIKSIDKHRMILYACCASYCQHLQNGGKKYVKKPSGVKKFLNKATNTYLHLLSGVLSSEIPCLYDYGSNPEDDEYKALGNLERKLHHVVEGAFDECCRHGSSREMHAYAISSPKFNK